MSVYLLGAGHDLIPVFSWLDLAQWLFIFHSQEGGGKETSQPEFLIWRIVVYQFILKPRWEVIMSSHRVPNALVKPALWPVKVWAKCGCRRHEGS